MANENLTQITAMIDHETIAKLEKFQKFHYYWKRNTIINGILTAVVDSFTDKEIYDMVRYWRGPDNYTDASFKILTPKK